MATRFERIEETDFIQEVLNGFDPKVGSHLSRIAFIGYRLIGVSEKLILEILRNKELNGSLFYLDIDDEYKELTEDYLMTNEQFRAVNIKRHYVSNVYAATYESVRYLVDRLPK